MMLDLGLEISRLYLALDGIIFNFIYSVSVIRLLTQGELGLNSLGGCTHTEKHSYKPPAHRLD